MPLKQNAKTLFFEKIAFFVLKKTSYQSLFIYHNMKNKKDAKYHFTPI